MDGRCLLITGSIVPHLGTWPVFDLNLRQQAYLSGLTFYAKIFSEPIYFLENSAYDLAEDEAFQKIFQTGKVELLKTPRSAGVTQGKGFQEFEMLDQAVKSLAGRYASFIKVSGRYQYFNLRQLAAGDGAGLVIDLYKKDRLAITSLFSATFEFYENHLMDLYRQADDSRGQWIEKILYRQLRTQPFGRSAQLLPVSPEFQVLGGADSHPPGRWRRFRRPVRNIERVILRKLSINQLYV